MYVKLTRLDNTPIWINASFIVTVEPRKAGGSVVVPIGDGLDYDVKESVENVLALLGDAPAAAVVPVPPPPGLAPTRADALPSSEPRPDAAAPSEDPAPMPVKKATRTRAKAKASVAETAETAAAAKATETSGATATDAAPAKKPRATRKAKKPPLELSEDEIARLRKLAPGSVRKLQNTLASQFKTVDPDTTLAALEAHEVLAIDRDHIVWK